MMRDSPYTRNRNLYVRPPTRTANLIARSSVSTVIRPETLKVTRPSTITVARPGSSLYSMIPTARGAVPTTRGAVPTASGSGGLPGGGLSGGISTALGGIGGDISSTFGGIINQFKGFIPTAVKIIAVVIILKIVLLLVRGRR